MWSSSNEKNCLMHWGVLGMKWGERRYQNEDGTRTPLGLARERAARAGGKLASAEVAAMGGSVAKGASSIKQVTRAASNISRIKNYKDPSSLSDDDLRKIVNRMNLEQQYSDLTSRKISKGMSYTNDALDIIGGVGATAASFAVFALSLKKLMNK